jgi:hypothetical protein
MSKGESVQMDSEQKHSAYIKISQDQASRRAAKKPYNSVYVPSSSPPCVGCPKWLPSQMKKDK